MFKGLQKTPTINGNIAIVFYRHKTMVFSTNFQLWTLTGQYQTPLDRNEPRVWDLKSQTQSFGGGYCKKTWEKTTFSSFSEFWYSVPCREKTQNFTKKTQKTLNFGCQYFSPKSEILKKKWIFYLFEDQPHYFCKVTDEQKIGQTRFFTKKYWC